MNSTVIIFPRVGQIAYWELSGNQHQQFGNLPQSSSIFALGNVGGGSGEVIEN